MTSGNRFFELSNQIGEVGCALKETSAAAWMLAESLFQHQNSGHPMDGSPDGVAFLLARQCRDLVDKLGDLEVEVARLQPAAAP